LRKMKIMAAEFSAGERKFARNFICSHNNQL